MSAQPLPKAIKKPSLARAITVALLLIFFDAFWINQGVISALTGIGLVLIGLPLALLKPDKTIRYLRLRNLAIYAVAVALVFVLNGLNNRLAKSRAETLISAIKAFEQKYHRYPQTLNELTPEFMERIPLAKYTLGLNNFYYYGGKEGKPALFYVAFPPFGRPTYNFSDNRWGYID